MAVFLPADVVSEILLWLPAEPLLRFRSVSKIWCSLIDSDDFMKLHLHRSMDTKRNRKIICRRCGTNLIDTIKLDSLDVAGKLKYPLATDQCGGLVSCNGLLLSWTYWYENKSHEYKVDIAISNPSTGKYHRLPPSQEDYYSYGLRLLCFGYDAVNDDYKAVKFNRIKDFDDHLQWDVQVYSLKSNSWRTIKDFPYEICWSRLTNGVLAHGALHFVVATNYGKEDHFGSNSVAAFDLATEKTRLVSLPDFGVGNNVVYMDLAELEGCLCIVGYEQIVASGRNFLGVWVVKDYGVGESWNKLLSAAQLSFMGQTYSVIPVAYSKNGCEVLLQQHFKEFIWFHLENNAVRKVNIRRFSRCFQAQVFVQSLVPLGYGAKTIPEKRDNNKKKRKKIGMKR